MKTINKNSKHGQKLIKMYHESDATSIYHVYRNPSPRKINAAKICEYQMMKEEGFGFKIISYNTFQFNCAWETIKPFALRIETASNSYIIKL